MFDPFIRSYLKRFQGKSITTDMFKDFLYEFFADKTALLDSVDWQAWFFGVGMPPVIPDYDRSLAVECTDLMERWIKCSEDDMTPLEMTPSFTDLSPLQQREFLQQLLFHETCVSIAKLAKMQDLYHMKKIRNTETKFRWLRLCIKARWEDKIQDALEFATSQGRMKFVRPLFRDLYQWDAARQKALAAFQTNRHRMMYITSRQVAVDLELES